MTGFHSVMLSPDSVSLVNPPNTTIPKTLVADARSQYATLFDDVSGKEEPFALAESLARDKGGRMDEGAVAVGAEDCLRRCGCRNARRKGVDLVDRKALWRVAACCWMQRRQTRESRMRFALRLSRRRRGEMIGVAMVAEHAVG